MDTLQKPKGQHWLILLLILAVMLVAVVIIYIAQSGQYFRGAVFDESLRQYEQGPIIHISETLSSYACDVNNGILGSADCPFTSVEDAYALALTRPSQDPIELRFAKGNYSFPAYELKFTNRRVVISGGYDNIFSEGPSEKFETKLHANLKLTNVEGQVRDLTFTSANLSSKPIIEIDNRPSSKNHFTIENLNFVSNNAKHLILFRADEFENTASINNNTFNSNVATDGALIRLVGIGNIEIFNNFINRSSATDGLIRVDQAAKIYNNLIVNTPEKGDFHKVTPAGIKIGDGSDVLVANNTLSSNKFDKAGIYQTGDLGVKLYNNLVVGSAVGYNVTENTKIVSNGNGWFNVLSNEIGEKNSVCNPRFTREGSSSDATYYKISDNSSCKDAGYSNVVLTNVVKTDYFGTPRPQLDTYDVGFHEAGLLFAPLKIIPDTSVITPDKKITPDSFIIPEGLVVPDAKITPDKFIIPDGLVIPDVKILCGNGILSANEECDDGNTVDGDGCSSICLLESLIVPECGNGIVEAGEECDDGNQIEFDGCTTQCLNIQVDPGLEDICDNMNGIQLVVPNGFEQIGDNCFPIPDPDDDDDLECGDWSDVNNNDPEYDIWVYLCDRDILKGHEDGTLRIDESLTRAELLALAFRASDYENEYEVDEDANFCFLDVDDQWFAQYACTALDEGFVQGYSGNIFGPGRDVILAEGLKMFLGALDEPFTINPDPNRWYYNMLEDAADDNYLPYTLTDVEIVGPIQLTRRKAANMLYRILKFR